MKQLSQLTKEDGEAIIDYLYPNNDNFWFISFKFDKDPKDIYTQEEKVLYDITYHVLGINYTNGSGDGLLASFSDVKVFTWLYRNGFDVTQYIKELEDNFKELEDLCDSTLDCSYNILQLTKNINENYSKEELLDTLQKIKKANYYKYKEEQKGIHIS